MDMLHKLDELESVGTNWIALYVNNNVIFFDSFGVEHIPKEILKIYHTSQKKTLVLPSICSKNEDEKLFEEESIGILKILGLIENA